METGTLILKKTVTSKKFNVLFHKDTIMEYFKDSDNNILLKHALYSSVFITVDEKNIKEINKH